jgi:D-beta-D-heptose 7-phosphate kinase/D-beta-D-heptose 1-phosphate adenosyltransferase
MKCRVLFTYYEKIAKIFKHVSQIEEERVGINLVRDAGMNDRFPGLIENFKNLKILVIGDSILDTYVLGMPEKICREAPVLVFNVQENKHQCGGAANTAINIASLGAETYFLTVVGKDANSKELIDILRENKIRTEYIIRDKSRVTVAKKRITASSNMLMRIDEGSTNPINEACEKEMLETISKLFFSVDAIILSDYGNGVITNSLINGLKEFVTHNHKPVIVDARDLGRFKILKPEAVKPNYDEAIKLLNIERASENRVEQISEYALQLHDITGAAKVAVTLDIEGVLFFEKGKDPYRIMCVPGDNKKAIGAGDTFISALTLSLASKLKGTVAAEIAAAAAAVVVQKDGTSLCTNSELRSYFHSIPKCISSFEELTRIVKDLKKQGKKIVFTNGYFDIIHKGHISLLNSAREAGDVLIVGVNSDESIRKAKGPERPINSLEDRMTVLAGLKSVDYMIAFEEESPLQLIKTVHPDVFVKGATYTEHSIPESPLLKKLGCKVKIVPYVKDHSTTHIIQKIKETHFEVETDVAL